MFTVNHNRQDLTRSLINPHEDDLRPRNHDFSSAHVGYGQRSFDDTEDLSV